MKTAWAYIKRKGPVQVLWICLLLMAVWQAGIQTAQGIDPPGKAPAVAPAPAKAPATAPAVKTTVAPAVAPAVPPPEPEYHYNPEGKIDPFKPFVNLEALAKKKAAQVKALPLNPLQRLGVEQFKLVGIIEGDRGRRAMVQDPSGKFYSLSSGAYIGLNKGRVSKILKDSVLVTERVQTDEGKFQTRTQIMKLRQDEVKP